MHKQRLILHIPEQNELWFVEQIQQDPFTMAYNANLDLQYPGYHKETGCIDFPKDKWADFIEHWIGHEPERFFAYVERIADSQWIGTVNFHQSAQGKWWDMGVVIYSPYRQMGYGTEALNLLVKHAFIHCGISEIRNEFEINRNDGSALQMHLAAGFKSMSQTVGLVEVRITREDYLLGLATTKS